MKCVIIDDNEIARLTIERLIDQAPELEVSGRFSGGFEALRALKDIPADLLFLDITMEDMSGIDLVKSLPQPRPLVIFMTANSEYALEAFELNVVDYLVKPIQPQRFFQAVQKAMQFFEKTGDDLETQQDNFLFIRDSNIVKRVSMDDILYIEAMGDYIKLFTQRKMYAIHKSMKAVEERLPTNRFIRVHRSYIVAVDKIDTIEQGALSIEGKVIPVADAYRNTLNKRLRIL